MLTYPESYTETGLKSMLMEILWAGNPMYDKHGLSDYEFSVNLRVSY